MGNEHGKEQDPNGHGTTQPGTGEKVKKGAKKPKKKDEAGTGAGPSKASPMLKDIDTSKLKHDVTDPIEDYYTVTEKVLGRYVQMRKLRKGVELRVETVAELGFLRVPAPCARLNLDIGLFRS